MQAVPRPKIQINVATRWDEKAGLRTGCVVRSQVIDVLKAQIKRKPAMKKVSTGVAKQSRISFSSEADDWSGPGRSIQLVLRIG
jgi:hypothetical protein